MGGQGGLDRRGGQRPCIGTRAHDDLCIVRKTGARCSRTRRGFIDCKDGEAGRPEGRDMASASDPDDENPGRRAQRGDEIAHKRMNRVPDHQGSAARMQEALSGGLSVAFLHPPRRSLAENSMLGIGSHLPDVALSSDDGTAISTSSFLGTPLVLYFYPKDDTPGCTSEAGQFTALYESFRAKGVRIVGVSRDTAAAHQKFKAKYDIPYPLLADVESKLCDACGVIVEKTMYGKKSMGLQRSTFLFDAAGTVAYAWKKVSVEGHAAAVFAKLPETVCRAG